ncbi:MAG: hypothetical protein DI576_04335 [Actinomyces sp.]|nr:MAG: hypothetical protein DI576_04335 [Actinomyces sp.]
MRSGAARWETGRVRPPGGPGEPRRAGGGPTAGAAEPLEPISARKRTDLEPEYDRSRRGSEPISAKGRQ